MAGNEERAMFDNAEFVRNLRGDKDLPRGALHVACYVVMAGLWVLYHYARFQAGEAPARLAEPFLVGMMAFHFVAAAFAGLLAGGASIARDKENGTLDSQRLTALSPVELALGKLFGLMAPVHFVNLLGLPMALAAVLLGGYDPLLLLAVFAILTMASLFYCALGLLMSTGATKGDNGSGNAMIGGLLLTGVLAGCPMPVLEGLTPVPALFHLMNCQRAVERYYPPLAGVGIPIELITLLFYTLGTLACVIGVTRYFENPSAPPWTRRQLLIGYAGVMGAGLAFLLSFPAEIRVDGTSVLLGIAMFQSILLVALLGCGLLLTPDRERTELELWRGAASWREMLFGERGSPLPFLLLTAMLANAVPLTLWASPTFGGAIPPQEMVLLLVVGNALIFLSLKLAGKLHEYLGLVAPAYARFLTLMVLLFAALGPLGIGMSMLDRFEEYLPLLLLANPPFVLINLVSASHHSYDPPGLATTSILLLCVAASAACFLASRRRAQLAAEIARRREALG
ncbi:MAG: ABC transporter permease subunit [Candidatus Wallbacteria bacterium]|nr:ABC transporter permease subunit [Candidatus Wallbacteria bacterium]